MDSSGKGFSSPKNPPNPSFSGESDENDFSHNLMDSANSKPQNSKKFPVKHFMSPTVSTKSKVTVPKKKILGEKNESFSPCENAQFSKIPVPDSRNGLRHSGLGTSGFHQISTPSVSAYPSKSDDGEVVSDFSADSSLRPYDPLTNYLSPRPKFLRYKPNRRYEIFHSANFGEKEISALNSQNQEFVEEEKASEFDQKPLTSHPQECSSEIPMVEAEKGNDYDDECTDDEEEDEKFAEKKTWRLKGMMKFLFLLAVMTLSTSYIATMNDPTPSPVVEAVGVLRDGFYRLHRGFSEAVFTNVDNVAWVNGSGLLIGDAQTSFLEVNKPFVSEIVQMTEPCDDGLIEEDISDDDDGGNGIEEDLNWLDWEIAEYEDADVDEEESDQFPGLDSVNSDAESDAEVKVRDNSEGRGCCAALEDISHHISDDYEGSFGEKSSMETFPEVEVEAEDIEEVSAEKSRENLLETECLTSESTSPLDSIKVMELGVNEVEAEVVDEDSAEKSTEKNLLETEGLTSETTPGEFLESMKVMKFGPISKTAAIGFSFLSIILVSLGWIYSTRVKQVPLPDSSVHEGSDRKEEPSLAQPSVGIEHPQQQEKAESMAKPLSDPYSLEETTKECSHIQAPSVELLGEFAIGEHSSSLRSCGRKGRAETEVESINPISHVESRTPPPPVAQVRLVNASKTDSSSYGSFTAEKIVLRKEAGDAKLITTPVRRSSRIRNLSITSP